MLRTDGGTAAGGGQPPVLYWIVKNQVHRYKSLVFLVLKPDIIPSKLGKPSQKIY